MIRIVLADASEVEAEAFLRPVSSDLEAVTSASRRLELRAGAGLQEYLQRTGHLPVGGAVITPGGELKTDYLIHAVVQSREENPSEFSVQQALLNGLRRASEWGVESLALFPLGTGAGSLDVETAASLMVPIILRYVQTVGTPGEVIVVVSNEYERDAFHREVGRATPVISREQS